MSRVGKVPVKVPSGVTVTIDKTKVLVQGQKGTLERTFSNLVAINEKDGELIVSPKKETKQARAMYGTTRAHLANMVQGVSEGWSKTLELVGTGYRAETNGTSLTLNVGYSHPVKFEAPKGITFKVEKTKITIEGSDKEAVTQLASLIRRVRPPEPYQGKGIKYDGEKIRRKAGKAAKAGGK